MSEKKYIPPWIYCPRCGKKIELKELEGEELEKIKEEDYDSGGRGICSCGVVVILVHQPLPKSPTFSLFFDIYEVKIKEAITS
ncbi:MAG: hypothetical protein QXY65_02955 [Candidatus Methanomethylicaceae archaeon]